MCRAIEGGEWAICTIDGKDVKIYVKFNQNEIEKVCVDSKDSSKKDECLTLKKIFEIPIYHSYYNFSILNSCNEFYSEYITHDYISGEPLPEFSQYKRDKINQVFGEPNTCSDFSYMQTFTSIKDMIGNIVVIEKCTSESFRERTECKYVNFMNGNVLGFNDMLKDKAGFIKFAENYIDKNNLHGYGPYPSKIDIDNADISDNSWFYFTEKSLVIDTIVVGHQQRYDAHEYIIVPIEDAKKFLKDEIVKAAWGR